MTVYYGNSPYVILFHQPESITHICSIGNSNRIINHPVLSSFNFPYLLHLLLYRHIFMNDTYPPASRNGYRQICLGHRIHRCRNYGGMQLYFSCEISIYIHFSWLNFATRRNKKDIIKSQSLRNDKIINKSIIHICFLKGKFKKIIKNVPYLFWPLEMYLAPVAFSTTF